MKSFVKTLALSLLVLGGASHATIAVAGASKSQCAAWSAKSDRQMGGCRSSYMNGEMSAQRAAQCCEYRLETISTWKKCTAHFGPVGWDSLKESKKEWGCR